MEIRVGQDILAWDLTVFISQEMTHGVRIESSYHRVTKNEQILMAYGPHMNVFAAPLIKEEPQHLGVWES